MNINTTRASLIVIPALALCAIAEAQNERWVGGWGAALHGPAPAPGPAHPGVTNQTVRQFAHMSIGGTRVRVRLSAIGGTALRVGAARIALRDSGAAIVAASDRALTFGGHTSITIPPGAPMLSDPVDIDFQPLSDLAISIYLPETTGPAAWRFNGVQTSYISPPGDFTTTVLMPVESTARTWLWFAGVDVIASEQSRVVVAFGDSISEGTFLMPDTHNSWPEHLARRLAGRPGSRQLAVLNASIPAGRLLNDGLVPNALARLDRDVLTQSGVRHVIVMMGNNDIGIGWPGGIAPDQEVTAAELIEGHRQLIARARTHGLKIYAGTLTPFEGAGIRLGPQTFFPYFSPENEAKRQAVNAWIRSSGEFDDVIDFDAVVRDPMRPAQLRPEFDSGDHLHLNNAGYEAMAQAIDLKLFQTGSPEP